MTSVLRGVVSYPIPLYSNVPIRADYFQPSRFVISDMSLGITTTITTTEDMNYVIGQEIRLLIPSSFGCFQLNGKTGFVLDIPATNQITVSIDSSVNVNAFIASSSSLELAQILAIGDINTGYQSNTGPKIVTTDGNTNVEISGSFINISPQ